MNNTITQQPITEFLDELLIEAATKNASDIHFEPFASNFIIRMRFDGKLFTTHTLTKQQQQPITSKLKLNANLDIAQKRLPQDGRFSIQNGSHPLGIRMNTCPTLFGEKIVLRILPKPTLNDNLNSLGFDKTQEKSILSALHKPQGLIIVTGPTGSGKTISLYTFLNCLDRQSKNIMTIEDPIEIPLDGINQLPINPKTGFGFHQALRSILRQDPDVMMIGEIRDKETAEIAIKAAQTGHLVLCTLHTNGAWQTINRLLQMDIPAYQLASAISLITASRLVRKLCTHCKLKTKLPLQVFLNQGLNQDLARGFRCYKEVGCPHCHQGFFGRIGIHEVLTINSTLQQSILSAKSVQQIRNITHEQNITSLHTSGLMKVINGMTSIREINEAIDKEN